MHITQKPNKKFQSTNFLIEGVVIECAHAFAINLCYVGMNTHEGKVTNIAQRPLNG